MTHTEVSTKKGELSGAQGVVMTKNVRIRLIFSWLHCLPQEQALSGVMNGLSVSTPGMSLFWSLQSYA